MKCEKQEEAKMKFTKLFCHKKNENYVKNRFSFQTHTKHSQKTHSTYTSTRVNECVLFGFN